jgi:D-3-phosphoglycerate dehydrogenase
VIAALDAGWLRVYVCDFPCNALKDQPAVVALPHLGASTNEAEDNCPIMAADALREFLENGNVRRSVNFPDAVLPRAANRTRIAIANVNVPNMVGQISTYLASAGLNIADLLNKSRGEYAYTLIDTDGSVTEELVARLLGIEGVLSARVV